jgi:membrane protein implicated in regulation of membrane protease activity
LPSLSGSTLALVLLIGAILAAVYILPRPWGIVVVVATVVFEFGEKVFWFRYSRRRPILVGKEAMIGANARVVSDCLPSGLVRFRGELWRARCPGRAVAGDRVRIGSVGTDLTLEVVQTP